MNLSANFPEGPSDFEPIGATIQDAMIRVRGDIDKFVGMHMEKILGKPVLDLYVEAREKIPGVELIINQQGHPPGRITVSATLKFRDKVIGNEVYVLELRAK